MLKRVPAEQRVKLMGLPGNDGWTITFNIADPSVRDIHYRTEENAPFKSTGVTDNINKMTGLPMPNANVRLPGAFWQLREFAVKYTDAKGREHGPFKLAFDPRAQYLRFAKQVLGSIEWVSFRDSSPGKRLAYFTALVAYKAALQEIRYSVDSPALDKRFPLSAAGVTAGIPGEIKDDTIYLPLPPAAAFVTVQIVYSDGTASEARRFDVNR